MAFFVSSYAVPLIVIVILYIVMLRRLWRPSPAMAITRSTRRPQPGNKSHQQNSNRNGWVVIHTYENEDYRNSDFDDNAGYFLSKFSPKIRRGKLLKYQNSYIFVERKVADLSLVMNGSTMPKMKSVPPLIFHSIIF